jgi:hypothetical protein
VEATSIGGLIFLSAGALPRLLMTNLNLVDCWTGRSAGSAPWGEVASVDTDLTKHFRGVGSPLIRKVRTLVCIVCPLLLCSERHVGLLMA